MKPVSPQVVAKKEELAKSMAKQHKFPRNKNRTVRPAEKQISIGSGKEGMYY